MDRRDAWVVRGDRLSRRVRKHAPRQPAGVVAGRLGRRDAWVVRGDRAARRVREHAPRPPAWWWRDALRWGRVGVRAGCLAARSPGARWAGVVAKRGGLPGQAGHRAGGLRRVPPPGSRPFGRSSLPLARSPRPVGALRAPAACIRRPASLGGEGAPPREPWARGASPPAPPQARAHFHPSPGGRPPCTTGSAPGSVAPRAPASFRCPASRAAPQTPAPTQSTSRPATARPVCHGTPKVKAEPSGLLRRP
jgi:hypothetical protein